MLGVVESTVIAISAPKKFAGCLGKRDMTVVLRRTSLKSTSILQLSHVHIIMRIPAMLALIFPLH